MKYIMNFGGGVNSSALYFVLREKQMPLDEIIFADTGAELPETYNVVNRFMELTKKDGVKMTIVKSHLPDLYTYYYNKKTVPSRMRRDCTSKFKVAPIRKYLREKYGKAERFTHYIGIALEEGHRMRDSDVSYAENSYPLVWEGINRDKCIEILKKNGFNEVFKSGCFCCPFTRKEGWITLMDRHPELFQKAVDLEENAVNKKVQLASIPLCVFRKKIDDFRRGQLKLTDFPHDCDTAGSCFL